VAARGRGRTIALIGGGLAVAAVAAGLYVFQPWRSTAARSGTDSTASPRAGTVDSPVTHPAAPPPAPVETTAVTPTRPTGSDTRRTPASRDSSETVVATEFQATLAARERALLAGAVSADLSYGDELYTQAQQLRRSGNRTDAFARAQLALGVFNAAEAAAQRRASAQRPADTPVRPVQRDTAVTPPPAPVDQKPQIRDVIATFGRAFEAQDTARLRRVFPDMPRDLAQAWQALFDKARDVRADLPPADIQVSGDQAEARVNGTLSYVEEGSGSRKSTPLRFTAELTKRGSAWIITSVQ
jgi:hypothetical protein